MCKEVLRHLKYFLKKFIVTALVITRLLFGKKKIVFKKEDVYDAAATWRHFWRPLCELNDARKVTTPLPHVSTRS